MEQKKIEQFTNQIKQWNRHTRAGRIMSITFFFVILAWNCIILDYGEWMQIRKGAIIVVLCEIGLLICYVASYLNTYTKINGKRGKLPEELVVSACRLPFSLSDYYAYIGKKLKKHAVVIGAAIAFVMLSGMFVYVEITEFPDVYSMETTFIVPKSSHYWCSSLLLIATGILLFCGVVYVTFRTHREMALQLWQEAQQGKGTGKKDVKQRKNHNEQKDNGKRILIVAICAFAWAMVAQCLRAEIMEVPYDIECYVSGMEGGVLSGVVSAILVQLVFRWKEYLSEGKRGIRKIAGIIVIVLAITVCYESNYTLYYEDRIEKCRFWVKQEYAWDEVKSYTVKKGFLLSNIQLELEMEKGTLKVIGNDEFASDEYYNRYASEYSYVAELVKRLDGMGISGTMEDAEKLEKLAKNASEWDSNAVNAIEEIKQITE